MTFGEWFDSNEDTIVDLFIDMIKVDKVFDCTFEMFANELYLHTDTECPYCKEAENGKN